MGDVSLDCERCFHHGCCVVFYVNVKPWEVDRYDVEKRGESYFLRRTGIGQCIYLSAGGQCMIHGRAPEACRSWSCCADERWPVIAEMYLQGRDQQTN